MITKTLLIENKNINQPTRLLVVEFEFDLKHEIKLVPIYYIINISAYYWTTIASIKYFFDARQVEEVEKS